MKENLKIGETVSHVGTPNMMRAPNKVQLSSSPQFLRAMSPVACFTKPPGNKNASNVNHSKFVNVSVIQPSTRAEITSGELDSAVERRNIMTKEKLKIKSLEEQMVVKENEVLPSAKQQGSPILQRVRSLSCLSKEPNSAAEVKIVDNSNASTHSKSPQSMEVGTAVMVINEEERRREVPKGTRIPQLKRVNRVGAMVDCWQKNKKVTFTAPRSPQLRRANKLNAMVDSGDKKSQREIHTGARSPKLKKADTLKVLFGSVEKSYKELKKDPRLSTSQLKRADIPNVETDTGEKSEKEMHTEPKSPRSKRTNKVKVSFDDGENGGRKEHVRSSCSQLKETNTSSGVISSMEEEENDTNLAPRNSELKKTDTPSGIVNSEKESQNETEIDIKAQEQEGELFPKETKIHSSNGSSTNSLTPSSPKLQSTSRNPPLQPERNSSGSTIVSNDADSLDNSKIYRSPKLNRARACARLVAFDPWINEHGTLEEQTSSCKGIYKVDRSRSLSVPLAEKSEKENDNYPKKETVQQENHDRINFAKICDHVPLPSNQKQTRYLLSTDEVSFMRKSTGDIQEALQTCSKELEPLWDPFEEVQSAMGFEINQPNETSIEQGSYNQMTLSPCADRRPAYRTRASSMSKVHEASDDKMFAGNLTAFTLKTQLSAFHKPVKFREITEPLKKSKWFHALSQIRSDGDFRTAMLEIQKQKEREKVSGKKKPSVAASFEEIRRCRYLRIPEHYQVQSKAFQDSSSDVDWHK